MRPATKNHRKTNQVDNFKSVAKTRTVYLQPKSCEGQAKIVT